MLQDLLAFYFKHIMTINKQDLHHSYIFTFPLLTDVVPVSTITFDSSTSFNLSPGLKAGNPWYGHVAHRNESPK